MPRVETFPDTGRTVKYALRTVCAVSIAGLWLTISLFSAIAVNLMSADEDWQGWSDFVGIGVLYIGFSVLVWAVVWLLVRNRT